MTTKVALAGFGSIGKVIAKRMVADMPEFELAAIGAREPPRTEAIVKQTLAKPVPVVPSADLCNHASVLLECVPAAAFREVVEPALKGGMTVISVSGAALLDNMDVVDVGAANGGKFILATGAIVGLDAIRAVRFGEIRSVTMVTRKPAKSLQTAKDVVEKHMDLSGHQEPECLFKGTAREGARRFPANVNVAAAVALAGAGPDDTSLEIWLDPAIERNTHTVVVEADTARIEVKIENVPSEDNPGTGRVTALSMLAALARLQAPLVVGT